MPRPITISTEHIVECARAQFLENGFSVPTSAIASAARISEGTIFKRFPTKLALFSAAMGLPEPRFLEAMPERVGSGQIAAQLRLLGAEIYDFYSELMPRVMMTISKGGNPEKGFEDGSCVPPPVLVIQGVMRYFEAEEETGRLCCKHPELAARMFVGTIVHSVLLNLRIPNVGEHIITQRETILEHLVDTLLQGVGP
jgi:AcrR family transcriptional regulator